MRRISVLILQYIKPWAKHVAALYADKRFINRKCLLDTLPVEQFFKV